MASPLHSRAPGLPLVNQGGYQEETQTTTRTTTTSFDAPGMALDPEEDYGDYSELQLAPARRETVVTTVTTTTVHFAPLKIPRPRAPPVAGSSSRQSSVAADSADADRFRFDQRSTLSLDPNMYPLSRMALPSSMTRFRFPLGPSEATFTSSRLTQEEEVPVERRGERAEAGVSRKGKGKALPERAGKRKVRRSAGLGEAEDGEGMEAGADGEEEQSFVSWGGERSFLSTASRLPSPGPPRKRPRGESIAARSPSPEPPQSVPRRGTVLAAPPVRSSSVLPGALPSPNQSPPVLMPSRSAGKDAGRVEPMMLDTAARPAEEHLHISNPQAIQSLYALPNLVEEFSALPPNLQSYVLLSLLQRAPVPVLQAVNNVVGPSFRRDFLATMPPELAYYVLSFCDHKSLCRASSVSKRWRSLIDCGPRVWREKLVEQKLWFGGGKEDREIAVLEGGPTPNETFLQRWSDGVWSANDPATNGPTTVRFADTHNSRRDNRLLSPSTSNPTSLVEFQDELPKAHVYKELYRRRYLTRSNWTTREPTRLNFSCSANNVITCLQFDEDKIVTASDDQAINVYDMKTGVLKQQLLGHGGGVWALQYIGNTLISGSTDRTVRIWDLSTGQCTHVFAGHTSTVRCLQIVEPENINPDPEGPPIWEPAYPMIVTGSRDWTLRVWKLPMPGRDPEYHAHISQAPPSPSDDPNATAAQAVILNPLPNPYQLRELKAHRHAIRALAAKGTTLVSGSYDCHVRVWDILSGDCKFKLVGHTQKVYAVVYDHERRQCASGSMDGTVRLWSTETGQCRAVLEGHTSLVGLLGLSFQNLVSAAADSTLRIWDPKTGALKHSLEAHAGAITCFQHDDYKVISGSDGTLKMWDVQSGEFVKDLLSDVTGVWQLSFDSRFCVAAVQRDQQTSEFEVIDFGSVDSLPAPIAAIVDEDSMVIAVDELPARLDGHISSDDEGHGLGEEGMDDLLDEADVAASLAPSSSIAPIARSAASSSYLDRNAPSSSSPARRLSSLLPAGSPSVVVAANTSGAGMRGFIRRTASLRSLRPSSAATATASGSGLPGSSDVSSSPSAAASTPGRDNPFLARLRAAGGSTDVRSTGLEEDDEDDEGMAEELEADEQELMS